MPDITMCTGGDCPRAKLCYRHTAMETEGRQAFFKNPPVEKNGDCRYYWPRASK
jgi:hypothetical protein